MPQNIYDNQEFYNNYIKLPRQVRGLAGAPEWPTICAMLPDLENRRVADLGCGFGWFARWAREHGAKSVLGVDVSKNMITKARADTSDDSISYQIADLETLELPPASFDFCYSALAFHYIENWARLVGMVYEALTPGSRFVFEIEHPIFMAATNTQWIDYGGGDGPRKTWPVNQYSIEGERRSDWLAKGVLKYHRTMATTLNMLIAAGFVIEHVEENAPSHEDITKDPSLEIELERPMFLIIRARR